MLERQAVQRARRGGIGPGTSFGENVRQERRQLGLSQDALAEAAGLHRTEISLLERDQREPRLSTILRLAYALGVPAANLLEGVE